MQVSEGVEQMVVEMNRTRGDPVLFVKPLAGGYQPGFLPTVLDYANYSDRCWTVLHLPSQLALPGLERACPAHPGARRLAGSRPAPAARLHRRSLPGVDDALRFHTGSVRRELMLRCGAAACPSRSGWIITAASCCSPHLACKRFAASALGVTRR